MGWLRAGGSVENFPEKCKAPRHEGTGAVGRHENMNVQLALSADPVESA
jgi:hypothetical protein